MAKTIKFHVSKAKDVEKTEVSVNLPDEVKGWQDWGWDVNAELMGSSSPRVQFQTAARNDWKEFKKDPSGYAQKWFSDKSMRAAKRAATRIVEVEKPIELTQEEYDANPDFVEMLIAKGREIRIVNEN